MFNSALKNTGGTPSSKHGYVAVLSYVGQQGSGLQALVSLQCMISSFDLPLRILEPLLVNSQFRMFHNEENRSTKKVIKFSDVFDIEHFNEVSQSLGYPVMEPRENFVAFAPKNVIFVNVKSIKEEQNERTVKIIWIKTKTTKKSGPLIRNKIQQKLDLLNSGFELEKVLEVTTSKDELHSYILSETEFRDIILGNLTLDNVTIIFSTWRTLWHIVNHHSRNPHKCLGVGYNSDKDQFYPSQRLLSDADRYKNMFLSSGYKVAVMFRIERLLQYVSSVRDDDESWTVDKCLDKAVSLTKGIQNYSQPMITLDLGKFASSSWAYGRGKKNVTELSMKVESRVKLMFKSKWTLNDWEDSFAKATGGTEDKGYIAALQRTLASRADCLVMIGGGSFQDLAMKDYIRNHPSLEDQCIHSVCTMAAEYVFEKKKNAKA